MKDRANSASRSDPAPSMMVTDRLLTVVEAARFLNLAPGTVYHLISQRRIPVIRFSSRCVRFQPQALMMWLESLTEKEEVRRDP